MNGRTLGILLLVGAGGLLLYRMMRMQSDGSVEEEETSADELALRVATSGAGPLGGSAAVLRPPGSPDPEGYQGNAALFARPVGV